MPDPESGTTRVRDLIVRSHGSTVLIVRRSTADEESAGLFGAVPIAPGDGLVLASPAVAQASGFRTALRQACRSALAAAQRTRRNSLERPRLWLAVPALGERARGRSAAQKLAREFPADIYAPSGSFSLVGGGCVYTGDDDHRWMRFTGNGPGEPHGTRYPRPEWEERLPRTSGYDGNLHVRPVPAGLAAVPDGAVPLLDVARWTPVSFAHPRLVLGGRAMVPPQAAALLRRFPEAMRVRMQIVPLDQGIASGRWLTELARMIGHDVVAAIGPLQHGGGAEAAHLTDELGNPVWRPFVAALRCSPDGSAVAVQANPAPRGWLPAGPLGFRWSGSPEAQPTPHEIIAKVVPAGLALVPASKAASASSADRLAFEPDRLTVTVGTPCTPLPDGAPLALNRLLVGLDREQLARVRILVLGIADRAARGRLLAAAGELRGRVAFPRALSATVAQEEPATLRVRAPHAAGGHAAPPLTTSSGPVATESTQTVRVDGATIRVALGTAVTAPGTAAAATAEATGVAKTGATGSSATAADTSGAAEAGAPVPGIATADNPVIAEAGATVSGDAGSEAAEAVAGKTDAGGADTGGTAPETGAAPADLTTTDRAAVTADAVPGSGGAAEHGDREATTAPAVGTAEVADTDTAPATGEASGRADTSGAAGTAATVDSSGSERTAGGEDSSEADAATDATDAADRAEDSGAKTAVAGAQAPVRAVEKTVASAAVAPVATTGSGPATKVAKQESSTTATVSMAVVESGEATAQADGTA
ncbi:hypothetical protein OOZ19_14820 [Saccharopolyspora sp. NFXS83]|uniref:hypothetical protein n=1 Tax=Saccharopolyspora sp. NFXS83 TaxID=2993560 RepID=UPI00224B2A29|nr:hypothetical protein [Saccharopolyspora sp. NFXS83]MCX2731516.1 hypothetical protein [Saccharopolyspora sp. NFXS83]